MFSKFEQTLYSDRIFTNLPLVLAQNLSIIFIMVECQYA